MVGPSRVRQVYIPALIGAVGTIIAALITVYLGQATGVVSVVLGPPPTTTVTAPGSTITVTTPSTAPSTTTTGSVGPSGAEFDHLTDPDVFDLTDSSGAHAEITKINGKTYSQSVAIYVRDDGSRGFATYVIGRHYTRFQSVVGIGDTAESKYRAEITITIDGEQRFKRVVRKGESIPIDLNTTGAYEITLAATNLGGAYGHAAFGDAMLVK